ncbi:hypothetical protein KUTeg_024314 [Tegillarca granosa]|uniref:SprT-like domain-containing protein n=1 Tax=Tegillarca granosa TaxID=220873 RepID=A0ABQ9DX02_TEGGR|nr:hypothetical protein KUTeg_024314 [Tegillarca granosa]
MQYINMSQSKSSSFNSNSSYFEVNDVSVQASEDAAGFCQTGKRNCRRTSDSSSVVEVNDVSQQTSLPLLSSASELSLDSNISCENNKNVSPNLPSENVIENSEEVLDNNLIDSSSSFVQVQDTSTQIDGIDTVSVEVKNDTCDVDASSSTEGKITDKTQYFDFSNSSVKSESTKGSKNSSVNSEISVNSKVNETKYFSDDGDHASYNIDNIDDANVTKSFSDSEQLYNLDQTKYFSGENDDSSKHDRNQDNNVTKSFSDSDQVDSLPEQTQYFSGDNENYRSLNSFDNQECNNSEVSNSSDQQSNMQDKTRYFDFASDKNASSENEFCEENDYLQTGKKSDKQSDQQETKVKCNFVEISSDEEFPRNKDRNKTKKLHKNLLTRENQEKPNTSRQFSDHDLDDSLPDPSVSQNKPKWRKTNGYHSDCSSSDDNLEQCDLSNSCIKMKTPAKAKKSSSGSSDKHNDSMADFIVNDSDMSSEDEDDDCFYLSTNSKLNLDRKNESIYIIGDDEDGKNTDETDESLFSSSSDSDKDLKKDKPGSFVTPVTKNVGTEKTVSSGEREKSTSREKIKLLKGFLMKEGDLQTCFCLVLLLVARVRSCVCKTSKMYIMSSQVLLTYIKTFKKTKDELLKKLFNWDLPKDLEIVWNKRLLQTAGYCTYKQRVRDTLIHELCHAAVWLLNGKSEGHGPYWKYWYKSATIINHLQTVMCRCQKGHKFENFHPPSEGDLWVLILTIGRHSKSLDTTRKVCGHCHSHFVLKDKNTCSLSDTTANQPKTPRTPNRFAMFVKENYGSVKKMDKNLKHKEIMNVLSKQFAEKNKIS